jgi:putative YphP/YqiW family bacilliredoxin
MMPSRYDRDAVAFMWKELQEVGVQPLTTPEAVTETFSRTKGTTLLVVNSVCGCAAGTARPGVALALLNDLIPDHLTTVFAGVDVEATQTARAQLPNVLPSSPSVFLFKNGELVHALHRKDIEGTPPQMIAQSLSRAFNEHCQRKGPAVPPETVSKVFNVAVDPACGSTYEIK